MKWTEVMMMMICSFEEADHGQPAVYETVNSRFDGKAAVCCQKLTVFCKTPGFLTPNSFLEPFSGDS